MCARLGGGQPGLPVTCADSRESCEVCLMVQSGEGNGTGRGGPAGMPGAWKPGALAGLPLHSKELAGGPSSLGFDVRNG